MNGSSAVCGLILGNSFEHIDKIDISDSNKITVCTSNSFVKASFVINADALKTHQHDWMMTARSLSDRNGFSSIQLFNKDGNPIQTHSTWYEQQGPITPALWIILGHALSTNTNVETIEPAAFFPADVYNRMVLGTLNAIINRCYKSGIMIGQERTMGNISLLCVNDTVYNGELYTAVMMTLNKYSISLVVKTDNNRMITIADHKDCADFHDIIKELEKKSAMFR